MSTVYSTGMLATGKANDPASITTGDGDDHVKFEKNPVQNNTCLRKIKSIRKESWLLIVTVAAIIIGVNLGLGLRATAGGRQPVMTRRQLIYLKFPGELFLRMLKMLILPLIVSSIVSSLAQLNTQTAGRLGLFTMLYYFSTTAIAVIEGIILVNIIRPGRWSAGYRPKDVDKQPPCISTAGDTILDLIRNLFPDNLISACSHSTKTCIKYENFTSRIKLTDEQALRLSAEERALLDPIPITSENRGINILGLIIFSMVLGVVISIMQDEGLPLRQFFKSLESAMMKIISLVIWYAPIGIIFLTSYQIVQMDDPTQELYRLTGYMITVMSGLFIHGVIILPLITFVCARRNPFKFAYGMLPALLTALGTSSSSATLPLTIKCCEENNGVDHRVAKFMLPLGATINMDGTALYEAVAVLYIAQVLDRPMTMGDIILVSLTATLASIGAAGIPQAGLITMIMVLIAVGLPSNYFILIVPVDWFLDRFRTLTNTHGDSLGTAVVQKFCESFLRKLDLEEEEKNARRQSQIYEPHQKTY